MGEAWSGEDAGGTGSDLGDGCCCDDGDDGFAVHSRFKGSAAGELVLRGDWAGLTLILS